MKERGDPSPTVEIHHPGNRAQDEPESQVELGETHCPYNTNLYDRHLARPCNVRVG